ncbi:MAG: hypothetical protein L0Y66_26105, partial [Myxococcaceae bacterium]|nr:hypothetical protein [Myxococcaceae bacterium]
MALPPPPRAPQAAAAQGRWPAEASGECAACRAPDCAVALLPTDDIAGAREARGVPREALDSMGERFLRFLERVEARADPEARAA